MLIWIWKLTTSIWKQNSCNDMDVSDMSTVLTDPTEGREWGRSVRRPDRDSVDDPLAALSDLQNTDQV